MIRDLTKDPVHVLVLLLGSVLIWSGASFSYPLSESFAEQDGPDYDSSSDEEYYDDYYDYAEGSEYYDPGYEESEPTSFGPTPFDDIVQIEEEDIVSINVLNNDRRYLGWKGSMATLEVSEPSFGRVTINHDNTITYMPFQISLPADYEKADVFRYNATAGDGLSYEGTVTVWIRQTNDDPIANSHEYEVEENEQLAFYLEGYDEDDDSLKFALVTNTTFGDLTIDADSGRVVYTPNYKFSGLDAMTYTVSDGRFTSSPELIRLIVGNGGVSSASVQPVPKDDSGTDEGQPIADAGPSISTIPGIRITLDGSASHDQNGDTLTFSWSQVAGPNVSLAGEDSAFLSFVAPDVDSTVTATFELVVADNSSQSAPASVTVTVIPVDIDVVPGVYPNNIKLSQPDALVPVAILGSGDMDASDNVDEDSLRFGPGLAEATSVELVDVNSDGFMDLLGYYATGDLGLNVGDKTACLSGSVEMNDDDLFPFMICRNVKVSN
jgi:hypothetical protein